MNIYVIIAAGGMGTRMQTNTPKQFLLVNKIPVLCQTILQFKKAYSYIKCIIVVPENYVQQTSLILNEYSIAENCNVVVGGQTRFDSVKNGINAIDETNAIVLVHDAARCLVSETLIKQCVTTTIEKGNAVPVISATDSLRVIDEKGNNKTINRDTIKIIQTPQTFYLQTLQKAFAQLYNSSFTDEASVVENLGEAIHLINGENSNIKITNPIDITIAESYFKPKF